MHTLEELLLQLGLGNLNLYSLVDLLLVTALVVGIVLDGGGEEGVDEGGLSQARLASNLLTHKHHTLVYNPKDEAARLPWARLEDHAP